MNQITLTKYVQSAFLVTLKGVHKYAFDFGSEVDEATITAVGDVTAVFISHQHPDHLHIPHLKRLGGTIFGPKDVVSKLGSEGVGATSMRIGEPLEIGPLKVTALNSDHGPNISAPIDNLAFLIKGEGKTILYLGDMSVPTEIPGEHLDLILIPVGGSKVFTPEQALDFIRKLDYHGKVVPVHYHGRADREAGSKFKMIADKSCDVIVCEVGQSVIV